MSDDADGEGDTLRRFARWVGASVVLLPLAGLAVGLCVRLLRWAAGV